MPVLFNDPIGWSASAVATRTRFWFMITMFAILQFALVYVGIIGGWRGGVVLAAFLAWFQFLFLFALRCLYLRVVPNERRSVA
jgi:hypothetical protein